MTDFKPKQGKIRKNGTVGIYQISENLWEGRFTPDKKMNPQYAVVCGHLLCFLLQNIECFNVF